MTVIQAAAPGLTDAAAGACDAICELPGLEWPCGQPAIGRYRRMCVHEHARNGLLCQQHADSPHGLCRTCRELPGEFSHACSFTLMPLSGPQP